MMSELAEMRFQKGLIEPGDRCEGQQERFLQAQKQQKDEKGKHGPTAEWGRGTGDK